MSSSHHGHALQTIHVLDLRYQVSSLEYLALWYIFQPPAYLLDLAEPKQSLCLRHSITAFLCLAMRTRRKQHDASGHFFPDRRLLIEFFWTFYASHLYYGSPKVAHTSLLGASCLLLRHKQTLLIAENANKILAVISVCSRKSWAPINSPKRNAQSPDRLHLHARALRRSNPVAIIDAAILIQAVPKRCGESIC
jgi:hypothetical protein